MTRILNVDDNAQNRYMLETLLKGYGYEVILAKNGKEALKSAKTNPPDLIISDILMPVMDGFDLCRQCKSDDRLKQIPFIFYTATYTEQKDEEFALSLGAERFVIKPKEPEILVQIVSEVLKEREKKVIVPSVKPLEEEEEFIRKHDEVLFHKLEKKIMDLENEIINRKKAENLLKESEEKYYSIYENSSIAILLTTPDGRILSANSFACKLFNRTEKEICKIGRNGLVDISDPRLFKLLEERKRTGSARGELTFIKKDGTKFQGEVSSVIFKNHEGNEQTSMVIRDLTEQKETQEKLVESEKKFRMLFENSPLGKSMTGIDGSLHVNKSFCNITGYSEEDLLSLKWMDITHPDDLPQSIEMMQSLLEGRISQARFEKRYIHKNGNIVWTDVSVYLHRNKKKESQFFITTISDITERKRVEEELNKSEARLRSYFELSSAGIAITSPTAGWIEVNDSLCKMLGYSREELLQTTWTKLTYFDDLEIDLIHFNRVLKGEIDGYSIDKRFICKDGKIIWTNLSVRCVRLSDGKVDYFVALLFDISERKRTEKALKESEELYRTLVEVSPDVIYTTTKDGIITSLNPAFEKITGWTRSEWIGKSYGELIHPDDIQNNIERFQKVLLGETQYAYEIRIRSKSGIYLIGEFTSGPYIRDGKIVGMNGIARDITERKKAEEAIRQSEEKFRTIFDNASEGIFLIDLETRKFVMCNASCAKMLGYSQAEFPKLDISDIHPDEDLNFIYKQIDLFVHGEKGIRSDIRFKSKNGRLFFTDLSPALGIIGNKKSLIIIFTDITKRKQAEIEIQMYKDHLEELVEKRTEELKKSNEKLNIEIDIRKKIEKDLSEERSLLRTLIDSVPDLIYIKDKESRFILANKNVINLFGFKKIDEIIGKNDFDILPKEIAEKNYTDEKKIISSGESLINNEEMIQLPNGEKYWYSITKVPLRDNDDNIIGLIGINRDITKLKIIEENLQKSKEAAEAANQAKTIFLSNMSHEIRTPMNVILGFSQLLLRDATLSLQQIDRLNNINRSGEHLLALINDILEISKIEAGHLTINSTKLNLHEFLNNIKSMFKVKTDAKQLIFKINSIEKLPKFIISDEAKLRQIFINLIGNAIKFTNKGEISVSVRIKKKDKNSILEAEVKDTGQGISEKDMNKIFNLFEQTEDGIKAGGTGLGLALSKKLVNILGGDISVKSALNIGSCFIFNIRIKECDQEEISQVITKQRVIGLKSGQKKYKVLITDDVLENRIFLKDMLKIIGFEVLEAENGKEAIKKYKEYSPDVILMDINMPLLNGFEATKYIKKMKNGKNIPIIVITSYVLNEEKQKMLEIGANECLSKPFKEKELFDALKSCLGIDYEYETEKKYDSIHITDKIKKDLSNLPEELISNMLDATISLELNRLSELILDVEKKSPETADYLRNAVKKYQYDLLMKLFLELRSAK